MLCISKLEVFMCMFPCRADHRTTSSHTSFNTKSPENILPPLAPPPLKGIHQDVNNLESNLLNIKWGLTICISIVTEYLFEQRELSFLESVVDLNTVRVPLPLPCRSTVRVHLPLSCRSTYCAGSPPSPL